VGARPIDRVAPSRRDSCIGRAAGRQTWRALLFLHWAIPEEAVRRLVPPALSIDVFEGVTYVGLVPFTMHDVRLGPLGLADFLEVNLRTYVHADGVPGVWFFSLDAVSRLAVWGGRALYRLPYFHAEMACDRRDGTYDYRSSSPSSQTRYVSKSPRLTVPTRGLVRARRSVERFEGEGSRGVRQQGG